MTTDTTEFTPRTATRARASYLAARTPEEFFQDPSNILKLSRDLAARYARRCSFMVEADLRQDVAMLVLRSARTWTPRGANPVPFGGFAWKTAELWLRGEMLRASIPVSGAETRADTESVRYTSTDAAVSSEDGATTLGAILGWEEVVGASSHRPDERDGVADLHAAAAEVLCGYEEDTRDALVAALMGTEVRGEDLPAGYTAAGFAREVTRVRGRLATALRPFAPAAGNMADRAPSDRTDDPWIARLQG